MTPTDWTLDERGWCIAADRHEHQAAIALAMAAREVQMRRGWYTVPLARPRQPLRWLVRMQNAADMPLAFCVNDEHRGEFDCPNTALVEADRWYRVNAEGQTP